MAHTTSVRNGIDVDRMLETIEVIDLDTDLARFTFRARSHWQDGTHNLGRIDTFTHAGSVDNSRPSSFLLHGDEPPALLGTDRGPNAIELVLQALAFCYAVGFAANAAAHGIEITSMHWEVEGEIDVRAFLGREGGRPGLTSVRATGRISSPNATAAEIEALCQQVQATSPVHDCLTNPVPVETVLTVH